jgi:hypothetical protein
VARKFLSFPPIQIYGDEKLSREQQKLLVDFSRRLLFAHHLLKVVSINNNFLFARIMTALSHPHEIKIVEPFFRGS